MASGDTNPWIRDRSDELALAAGMQFDAERGQMVCDWIEEYCILYEGEAAGEPVKLLPWCRDATMRLFGWIKWSTQFNRWVRRFTKASIWCAKKNAKSPILSMWGLYLLAGDGEPGNKVFFASKTGEQIRENSVKHAAEMVWASPLLSKEIVVNKSIMQLTHKASRSILRPLSSSDAEAAKSKEGLNGSVLIDETHVVDDKFIKRISRAGISRAEPLQVEVSTAGLDPDCYGKRRQDYGREVAAGNGDLSMLFICYEAPQDLAYADLEADPLKYGRMANPTMGQIVREDEYLADYTESKRSLAALADFLTYRLNIWQQASMPWIRKEDWAACRQSFTEDDLAGQTCCGGLDLAITRDMSALSLVFPCDDDRYRVLTYFFMPEAGIKRLAQHVPQIAEWVRDGYVTATPGETTDYRFIRRVFAEKAQKFFVAKLIYDEHFAEQLTNEMSEDTGVERLKLPQTATRLNEPTQNWERAVLDRKLEHDGNPVMAWQMGHVNIRTDANGNKRPVKPANEDHKKIDGVLSGIMGLAGARTEAADGDWYRPGGMRD